MYCNIWILAVIISVGSPALSTGKTGQKKIVRCKLQGKDMKAPDYKLGVTYEGPSRVPWKEEDITPMSIVHISIDSKNVNRDDMIRLALKLKNDFCKEERLFVVLFDDSAYINRIYVSVDAFFHKADESKRGYCYLDRITGEEYITYSTVPNYFKNPEKRVRIELGPPSTQKHESQQ